MPPMSGGDVGDVGDLYNLGNLNKVMVEIQRRERSIRALGYREPINVAKVANVAISSTRAARRSVVMMGLLTPVLRSAGTRARGVFKLTCREGGNAGSTATPSKG